MVVTNAAERPIDVLGGDACSFGVLPEGDQAALTSFPPRKDILFAVGVSIPSETDPTETTPEIDYLGGQFKPDERHLALGAIRSISRFKANILKAPQDPVLTAYAENALPTALQHMSKNIRGVIGGMVVYKTEEGVKAGLFLSKSLIGEMRREGQKMVIGPRYGHHHYGMSRQQADELNKVLGVDKFVNRAKGHNPNQSEVIAMINSKILAEMLPKQRIVRKELKRLSKQPVPNWLAHLKGVVSQRTLLQRRAASQQPSIARQRVAF